MTNEVKEFWILASDSNLRKMTICRARWLTDEECDERELAVSKRGKMMISIDTHIKIPRISEEDVPRTRTVSDGMLIDGSDINYILTDWEKEQYIMLNRARNRANRDLKKRKKMIDEMISKNNEFWILSGDDYLFDMRICKAQWLTDNEYAEEGLAGWTQYRMMRMFSVSSYIKVPYITKKDAPKRKSDGMLVDGNSSNTNYILTEEEKNEYIKLNKTREQFRAFRKHIILSSRYKD